MIAGPVVGLWPNVASVVDDDDRFGTKESAGDHSALAIELRMLPNDFLDNSGQLRELGVTVKPIRNDARGSVRLPASRPGWRG
jgi:hypothetical protein